MNSAELLSALKNLASSTPAPTSGSSINDYANLNLSSFTPGAGPAPSLGNVGANIPGLNSSAEPSFFQSMTGYKDAQGNAVNGWGGLALSAGTGIFGAINGMKQFGLMEDQLKEQKRQFDLNYSGQKKAFNSQLEDRQRARVASNAGAYQSVGDYMNKYAM